MARRREVLMALAASPLLGAAARSGGRRGFNLIESAGAPFASAAAARSLKQIAATGADSVALIPFLWQAGPADPGIVMGDALPIARLASGIAQAKAAELDVIVKPHVWVPGGWAGVVKMRGEAAWAKWFAGYRAAILPLARLAARAGAAEFVIGTEVRGTILRPEWTPLIGEVRRLFPGKLTYVAHGADEAERVPFWPLLDAVGVSLYPVLGEAGNKSAWHRAMASELSRVEVVAKRVGKPIWVGEIGIRSATGATLKPWESAEEREAPADPTLQADVIGAWLHELAQRSPAAVLVWRWFSDPDIGGRDDTDFTVQGKPAADVIGAAWR